MYTELEALNFLLSHVGAAPVSSTNNPLPDLASAQLRLHESMVWTQKRGWFFNRLYYQTQEPDESTGEIELPTNILKIISPYPEFVIARDDKAFSPIRNSFEFTEALTMDLVMLMDWEEIPGSAQDCVLYRAAQQMILHELEDTNKAALLQNDFELAYIELQKEDLQIHQRNMATVPSVQRFLHRVHPYKRYRSGGRNPVYPGGGLT